MELHSEGEPCDEKRVFSTFFHTRSWRVWSESSAQRRSGRRRLAAGLGHGEFPGNPWVVPRLKNVKNSEPIVGQPAHFLDISRYLVVSANWGFNFETSIYREMKDEDGELYTVMLFAAKSDPNCYPMWASGSFSGGWLRPSVRPSDG
ncbi:hypothetical protein PR003_g11218, partial [Phytophthora rubi]